MTNPPIRRHFVSDRVPWTARRQSGPSGIQFVNAFGEERVLPLEHSELPTDDQMASASERQLEAWLEHARREPQPNTALTAVERALLRRIAEMGGRCTFRPDGPGALAYRIFEEGIVSVLFALRSKQLVTIEAERIWATSEPGQVRFSAVTVQLTDFGQERSRSR